MQFEVSDPENLGAGGKFRHPGTIATAAQSATLYRFVTSRLYRKGNVLRAFARVPNISECHAEKM
jgi:hypothetical protein